MAVSTNQVPDSKGVGWGEDKKRGEERKGRHGNRGKGEQKRDEWKEERRGEEMRGEWGRKRGGKK